MICILKTRWGDEKIHLTAFLDPFKAGVKLSTHTHFSRGALLAIGAVAISPTVLFLLFLFIVWYRTTPRGTYSVQPVLVYLLSTGRYWKFFFVGGKINEQTKAASVRVVVFWRWAKS